MLSCVSSEYGISGGSKTMQGIDTVESLSAGVRGVNILLLKELPKLGLLYDVDESCQNISSTVGFTKTRAFLCKSC